MSKIWEREAESDAVFNAVSVSLADPGTPLAGSVALSATATSDRPIVSVRFQSSPAGAGTWTDRCTDTEAPYTCDWDTTAVSSGHYDLRAVGLDGSGYTQTSTVADRRVDNTAPAVALTDPGSPLTGTRSLAVKQGSCWLLNGAKTFTTNAHYADVCVAMAVTDRAAAAHGISAFIIPKETPGFRLGKKENKLGMRASATGEVIFQDCRLPDSQLLGNVGEGFVDSLRVLDGGRLEASPPSTVVDCTGRRPRVIRPGAIPADLLRESVPDLVGDA